jgi:transcriptional regulator with XRE-family HTH domain
MVGAAEGSEMSRKNTRFEDWLADQLKDEEFQAEWERLEPGYQVARLRIQRGITQQQLAERIGTTQTSISRLESGQSPPSLSFLQRVVDALGGELTVSIKAGKSELREEIKGVGEEYGQLLERAGVETLIDLARQSAESLREKLVSTNGRAGVVRRVPGELTVSGWIEQARQNPAVAGVGW